MGFTGAMQQFLRACCGKKTKDGKDADDANLSPPLVEAVASPTESFPISKPKSVREVASKQQPSKDEESAVVSMAVSTKKVSKSRKSRRPSSSTTANSSQYVMGPKSKTRSRRVSLNNNSKPRDGDDSTQPEESTMTARSRRKGKSQRIVNRDKQQQQQSAAAVAGTTGARKWVVESAVFRAQLKRFVTETTRIGVGGLVEQFAQMKAATSQPSAKTQFDENRERNRYKDVVCIDRTRVVLRWPQDSDNDYIHANWVEFKGEKKFICTQAPIKLTVDDFWRLVWQEQCKSIVMLCEMVEQNKKKCELYWPATVDETMDTASGLTIKNTQIQPVEACMTVTVLEVTSKSEPEAQPLSVKHYKWNNWPDRGVPDNGMAPFRLLSKLGNDQPVIIHCSAGIGRTGTIVGLHMALQVLNAGEDLRLINVVRDLRAQRHGSVQTDTQYLFMHRMFLQLAEKMSVCSADEIEQFTHDYEKFIKDRGG